MDKIGFIQIRISGSNGNLELNKENFDIKDIRELMENVEKLLFPDGNRNRPLISYSIESGSVSNVFKTLVQFVIGFNAIIGKVEELKDINFLDLNTSRAIEKFQTDAIKNNYNYEISTSLDNTNKLIINNSTNYFLTQKNLVEAEFYFYGKLTNAGGKDKANIHILTEDYGTLRIQTPKLFLEEYEQNLLYKTFGIRVSGLQDLQTGEIDNSSLKFIELVDYKPKYNEEYLNTLINKASNSWSKIDNKEKWLSEIRGRYA